MSSERVLPPEPLKFIQQCVLARQVLWTYHVTMRMEKRSISRPMILGSTETYELIEMYPEDKYLPSYLVWARHVGTIFHVLFAADVMNHNVRIITAYFPDSDEWEQEFKRRKTR